MQDKNREGKVIVYTYGVFDLFHSGHVELLKEAKELGDYLILGLFTDEVATGFKREPIIPLEHRIKVCESCKFVDELVVQNELPPDENLKKYQPNILAKGPGAGWGEGEKIPGEDIAEELGIKVVKLPYHDGISTSEIIKKIKNS